jgi:hypothetical protein
MTEHTQNLRFLQELDTALREGTLRRFLQRLETVPPAARTLRSLVGLETAVREAVTESKLAYKFGANSYTFSAMSACIAAESALQNLPEGLSLVGYKPARNWLHAIRVLRKISRSKRKN